MSRLAVAFVIMAYSVILPAEPLVDPTRPPAGYEVASHDGDGHEGATMPRLTGIKRGRNASVVILNGKAVTVGESVDGYELLAIGSDHVTLSRNGSELKSPLLPNVKKALLKGR